jgi:hypothetical protein
VNFSLCPRNARAIKLTYSSENNSPDDLPTALSSQDKLEKEESS